MKKIGTKLILLFIIIFSLTGCTNYLQRIDYNEFKEMIYQKESFILEITQDGCSHCEEYTPRFKTILQQNKVKAYYLNITYMKEEEYQKFQEKYDFRGTPTTMFFKEGKELINSRITGGVTNSKIKKTLERLEYIK